MECRKVKNVLALALVVRSRCEVLKASVKALVFGMWVVNNFNCRGFGPLLEDKLCLIFKLAPSVCRMTFPILASLLVRLVVLLPFQLLRISLDRKSGSAGMPRPISYAVFCLKKKKLSRPVCWRYSNRWTSPRILKQPDGARNSYLAHTVRSCKRFLSFFFFFNDTATTEIYTLSLHDALPISSL